MVLPASFQICRRSSLALVKTGTDQPEFFKNCPQQLMGRGGRRIEDFHRDFLDTKHISGKARYLIGMKKQRIFLVGAVFRVELAWVERGIEIPGLGVRVAIDRGSRAIQSFLNVVDTNETLSRFASSLGGDSNFGSVCDGSIPLCVERAKVGKHETGLGQAGMRPDISRGFLALQ